MTERVLITGVAGFIGSNLLDYLIEKTDWSIDGIDNLSTGTKENINHQLSSSRFNFIENDLLSINSLRPYKFVFHLAALPRIQPSFEFVNEHIVANVLRATHLLEIMIRENHYPRFIYSGSSAIYGTPENIPTNENERIDCLSPYAFQKYEVERYLELLATRYQLIMRRSVISIRTVRGVSILPINSMHTAALLEFFLTDSKTKNLYW